MLKLESKLSFDLNPATSGSNPVSDSLVGLGTDLESGKVGLKSYKTEFVSWQENKCLDDEPIFSTGLNRYFVHYPQGFLLT